MLVCVGPAELQCIHLAEIAFTSQVRLHSVVEMVSVASARRSELKDVEAAEGIYKRYELRPPGS
jgi:hypothetical protein